MWEDQYLTWDPMQHEEVRYIRLGAGEVWEPDLTLNIMSVLFYYRENYFLHQ